MGRQLGNVNPGVERDHLPQRRNKGSLYDIFKFPPNNRFGIPASSERRGWQSKSFDCIGTEFEVSECGLIYLRHADIADAADQEHSVSRELAKFRFCTDTLFLSGKDAYDNPRKFLIVVDHNMIQVVMEDDVILYVRPESRVTRFFKWLARLWK